MVEFTLILIFSFYFKIPVLHKQQENLSHKSLWENVFMFK